MKEEEKYKYLILLLIIYFLCLNLWIYSKILTDRELNFLDYFMVSINLIQIIFYIWMHFEFKKSNFRKEWNERVKNSKKEMFAFSKYSPIEIILKDLNIQYDEKKIEKYKDKNILIFDEKFEMFIYAFYFDWFPHIKYLKNQPINSIFFSLEENKFDFLFLNNETKNNNIFSLDELYLQLKNLKRKRTFEDICNELFGK